MSAPYLNRGETIILTTHRVGVENTEYDALLTNERLILMDRRYTRFEPRMVLFPAIMTVKAGKVPAGDPAIILTLEEPSDITGSELVNIIFVQEPGEDRKAEREQWVKELIGLVITTREQRIHNKADEHVMKKDGMQPSVRRWVAPESPHPRTSHETPVTPTSAPEVIAEGPDPMEFFLENRTKSKRTAGKKAKPSRKAEATTASRASTAKDPVAAPSQPHMPESEPLPEKGAAPEAVGIVQVPSPGTPVISGKPSEQQPADPSTADTFARLVASAAAPLYTREEPLPEVHHEGPVIRGSSEPEPSGQPQVPEPVPSSDTPATEPEIQVPVPEPQRAADSVPEASKNLQTPGIRRELPGTYTPDIPVTGPKETPPIPDGRRRFQESPGRSVIIAGVLVFIFLGILIGMISLSSIMFDQQNNPSTIETVTPSVTAVPIPSTQSAEPPAGVEVQIGYPGKFFGTLGNPGYLQKVSGTGNNTYPVLMHTDIVQATIRKLDNSGEALTVGIYNNRTLLSKRTITAPMGEVNLLINVSTELPPGLDRVGPNGENLRDGTLIYF